MAEEEQGQGVNPTQRVYQPSARVWETGEPEVTLCFLSKEEEEEEFLFASSLGGEICSLQGSPLGAFGGSHSRPE